MSNVRGEEDEETRDVIRATCKVSGRVCGSLGGNEGEKVASKVSAERKER